MGTWEEVDLLVVTLPVFFSHDVIPPSKTVPLLPLCKLVARKKVGLQGLAAGEPLSQLRLAGLPSYVHLLYLDM